MVCPHGYGCLSSCPSCTGGTVQHMGTLTRLAREDAHMGLKTELSSILQSGDFADITIKCGHTEIKAHSVIISARSDFFRAACQGPWKEAFTRVIELPKDDSKVCNTLLQFMYTGDYVVDKETEASCVEACHFHSEIFLAAKKYNIKFLPEVAECRLKLKVLQSV